MNYLTDDPLDLGSLVQAAMRPGDGACVTFVGAVRDHHQGRNVVSIDYQAYRPMAEKEIARIVEDLRGQHPAVAIALRHRLGVLTVGEASIIIVCTSPHRGDAFTVCRELIDRIKITVPIWKKERGPEGEEWVGWQWS
jgi:molybdopterin synthase catalytic subunit